VHNLLELLAHRAHCSAYFVVARRADRLNPTSVSLVETHVHVRSPCDAHVATRVARQNRVESYICRTWSQREESNAEI
jgi:hypothetical protein